MACFSSPDGFTRAVALRYASLEGRVRAWIDPLTARVCPGCPSPCCRGVYCRPTAANPWYAFVRRVAGGFVVPPDWASRRDPFGLGPGGCRIRAGRYVFCYSFNCRRLLSVLPDGQARRAFQTLSDLLLHPNRLGPGRLLHELADPDELTARDVAWIGRRVAEAGQALGPLRAFLRRRLDRTLGEDLPQDDRRAEPCPDVSTTCPPACTTGRSTAD